MKLFFSFFILMVGLGIAGNLRAQDNHYPEFMNFGNRSYNNQKYDLAIEYYQDALDDKADCWQAYVGLGNCYYYQKRFAESLKAYETALKLDPGNSEVMKFIPFLKQKMAKWATPTPSPSPIPSYPKSYAPLPPLPVQKQ